MIAGEPLGVNLPVTALDSTRLPPLPACPPAWLIPVFLEKPQKYVPFSKRLWATATQCNGMLVKPNPNTTAVDTAQRFSHIYTQSSPTGYSPQVPQEQSFMQCNC